MIFLRDPRMLLPSLFLWKFGYRKFNTPLSTFPNYLLHLFPAFLTNCVLRVVPKWGQTCWGLGFQLGFIALICSAVSIHRLRAECYTAVECVISISSVGSLHTRKAHRTELQALCSESLRPWGIIDFPKSQFKPIIWKKKKKRIKKVWLCSKSRQLSYYEKLNESKSKKEISPSCLIP